MELSIIIPIYNVEKYIAQCLSSIIEQNETFSSIEVIIINDGTKDNSMSVVKEMLERTSLDVRIVNNKNHGLSYSRNEGIKLAKGDYIWFVDSDDWISRKSISVILSNIKSREDLYIYPMTHFFERNGNYIEEILDKNINSPIDFLKKSPLVTPAQRFIIRKQLLLDSNLFFTEDILHEDVEFCAKLLAQAKTLGIASDSVYIYRRREIGSIVSTPTPKRAESLSYIIYTLFEYSKKKKILDELSTYLFKIIDMYFYTVAGLQTEHLKFEGNLHQYHRILKTIFFKLKGRNQLLALLMLLCPQAVVYYKIKRL